MTPQLKRRITRMSLEEKQVLLEFVNKSIGREERKTLSAKRCAFLIGKMGEIYGRDVDFISRNADDVWARTMVAYQMVTEGFTTMEIGDQLMKDHSTITHLCKKMSDALDLPKMYIDIIETWLKFQKLIENDIHERTIGDPVSI